MAGLIISTVGDESFHEHWLNTKADIWLVYYGDSDEIYEKYSTQCDRIFRMKGHKYPQLLPAIVTQEYNAIKNYSHVWLPDDDMKIDGESLDIMFDTAQKLNLHLCQPSQWPAHNISHSALVQERSVVDGSMPDTVKLTTVEPQAPCFSTKFLLKIYAEMFPLSYTGWGLDYCWGWLLEQDPELEYNPLLINNISMEHMRPVCQVYDEYRMKRCNQDIHDLVEKYNIPAHHQVVTRR